MSDQLDHVTNMLRAHFADAEVLAPGTVLADALLCLALDAALQVTDRRGVARVLVGLAERYIRDVEPSPAPAMEPTSEALHAPLEAAAMALVGAGATPARSREAMFAFVVAWIAKADGGLAAAARCYAAADQLAGGIGGARTAH